MYISGYSPKETPPADYRDMMNELYAISRNMNQIAHIANSGKHIESERYWTAGVNLAERDIEDVGVILDE